jgi:hypothetical protein
MPPAELAVHPAESAAIAAGRHELFLMCDDIEATVAELTGKGVNFATGISDEGFGLMTTLEIPGGGRLGLGVIGSLSTTSSPAASRLVTAHPEGEPSRGGSAPGRDVRATASGPAVLRPPVAAPSAAARSSDADPYRRPSVRSAALLLEPASDPSTCAAASSVAWW